MAVVKGFFLFCVAALATQPAFARFNPLIVGGVEAVRGEFPFMVSLQDNWGHFCGGSLIAKNWVLTAGHCAASAPKKVVIGLHDQKDKSGAEIFTAARTIRHPKYDDNTIDYDFALIKLSGDSKFAPIDLGTEELEGQALDFTVAGWGVMDEGDYDLPDLLQKVDVPFVGKEACDIAYPNQITDRMICAGLEEGRKDSCQGDSGGPMFLDKDGKRTLVGVVSWGEGCARPKKYGVYSKVSAVTDWIAETTK